MNIHKIYNSLSVNYNKILSRKSLFILKQTLRMLNKNIIINDFNLHYLY